MFSFQSEWAFGSLAKKGSGFPLSLSLSLWRQGEVRFSFLLTAFVSLSPFLFHLSLPFFFPSLSLFLVARQVRWVGWDFSGKFLVIMGFGGGGSRPFLFTFSAFFFPYLSLSLVAWLWEWTLIVSIVIKFLQRFCTLWTVKRMRVRVGNVLHIAEKFD